MPLSRRGGQVGGPGIAEHVDVHEVCRSMILAFQTLDRRDLRAALECAAVRSRSEQYDKRSVPCNRVRDTHPMHGIRWDT